MNKLRIIVTKDIHDKLLINCIKSGVIESGGMIFGEHVGHNTFRIESISIEKRSTGSIASFVRTIEHAIDACKKFFQRTNQQYKKYNYLGEWHTHPKFTLVPSNKDHQTMIQMVNDHNVGANFAVLILLKLDRDSKLEIRGWSYHPPNVCIDTDIVFDEDT